MKVFSFLTAGMIAIAADNASAAFGEMGTGVPTFGIYGQAVGPYTAIWSLANATRPVPAGCTALYMFPATMGADHYKAALAILISAKLSGARVRFYAHADRDGGCGVDFVGLED